MKHMTLAKFILMMQEEYQARFGERAEIQEVTFLRNVRENDKETLDLIMALADRLKVPVSRGRMRDEYLLKGTYYNAQDLYEEFVRLTELVDIRQYRLKWWSIGAGMGAVSLYCLTQSLPVHSAVLMIVVGGIFERLKGMPRVY